MPNVLATPRFWEKKAILAKAETTVGTDAVPTGAANWMEARNVSLTPYDAETAERNNHPSLQGKLWKDRRCGLVQVVL